MSNMSRAAGWITAAEALEQLKVRPQTLYAYVSRGRVQARPDTSDPRRSLYSEPDIARLAQKRRIGRRPEAVAASAIAWGEPVLASTISTVWEGRLLYRGRDAVDLSKTTTLEETARLLWDSGEVAFARAAHAVDGSGVRALFQRMAELAATADPALGRSARRLHAEAFALIGDVIQAIAGRGDVEGAAHARLAGAWGAPQAAEPLRRALVLLADHELNVSTFAARVTASSGASLAASVLAGLSALSGPLHGRAGLAVAHLVDEAAREGAAEALRRRLAHGQFAPGFGHPLYAGVDPRAAALLDSFEAPARHDELRRAAEDLLGLAPNVDFALSAMTARFALPAEAPLLIFAAARSVGWIAHALEQGRDGTLIRPRARYVGPLP